MPKDALLAGLLTLDDAPAGFGEPIANVVDAQTMTDVGLFRIDLCDREPSASTPEPAPPWLLAASAVFPASATDPIPPVLDQQIVAYADEAKAGETLEYFGEWLLLCETEQSDPDSIFEPLSLPKLADETLAFAARPRPGTPAAREGRPDLHQVLIRRENVLVILVHRGWPSTDVETTEQLARRALEKAERALDAEP